MFFAPLSHKSVGLSFNPIKALISPRPIGWISSKGKDGSVNLAPYSFFNGVSDDPPMIMFAAGSNPDGSHKDSLRNVTETGEFTVNIVGAEHLNEMNITSGAYPYGENEFDAAGLTMIPGDTVDVPRVDKVAAALECRHYQTVDMPKNATGAAYAVVFGTITGIYINDDVVVDGKVAYDRYKPLCRLGYHDYAEINDTFTLTRPEIKT